MSYEAYIKSDYFKQPNLYSYKETITNNYQVITNDKILLKFIDWLPELQPTEKYYVALFARKKYINEDIKVPDKAQLKRFTATKDYLYGKIKQLQCELGSYSFKDIPVPQECLSLYINPNPRCMVKSSKQTLRKLADCITNDYNGYNPHSIAMNNIQTSCSRKIYFDFDIDGIDYDALVKELTDKINFDCLTFLHTRGGYHLLVELSKIDEQYKKNWYNTLSRLPGCDVKGDNLIPVPGTFQGGFTPYFM